MPDHHGETACGRSLTPDDVRPWGVKSESRRHADRLQLAEQLQSLARRAWRNEALWPISYAVEAHPRVVAAAERMEDAISEWAAAGWRASMIDCEREALAEQAERDAEQWEAAS